MTAPHAVSVLRTAQLVHGGNPFLNTGGFKRERCAGCRLAHSHCLCAWRPRVPTRAGVCLLMAASEALKPSNTGWLIADVVADTFAFGWARTEVDPALLALLADPQWEPFVVFPGQYAAAERVVRTLGQPGGADGARGASGRRPLFVLLDGTWSEARKIFGKSPYLDRLPVLSLEPDQPSNYQLRRSNRNDHFCTSEVAALCMALAGDSRAARTLEAYLAVFTTTTSRRRISDRSTGTARRISGCAKWTAGRRTKSISRRFKRKVPEARMAPADYATETIASRPRRWPRRLRAAAARRA